MAKINGTVVISSIVPTDSNDLYSTHNEEYGKGGYRTVATIIDRDNISEPRRKSGMVVYVESEKEEYRLEGGIDNSNWVKIVKSSTGEASDVEGENVKSTGIETGKVLTSKGDGTSEWTTPTGGDGSGVDGKSAYELYVETIPEGEIIPTIEEWLESLKGKDGVDGLPGMDGKDGADGKDGVDSTVELAALTDKVDAKGIEANKVLTSKGDGTSEWLEPTGGSGGDVDLTDVYEKIGEKQDILVSGETIKTINNESLLGQGDIAIEPVSVDASTLTEGQLDYLRDKQMSYGAWITTNIGTLPFTLSAMVTRMPIFRNAIKEGNLVNNDDYSITLKKGMLYRFEFFISCQYATAGQYPYAIVNSDTGDVIKIIVSDTVSSTGHRSVLDQAQYYFKFDEDTRIEIRPIYSNGSINVLYAVRVQIAEISSVDMKLARFTINGKSFDNNNNIDLEGLSTLSNPVLNQETLTEFRHPVSGKPIYTKTIDFGALPNKTVKNVAHNVPNVEDINIDDSLSEVLHIDDYTYSVNYSTHWQSFVNSTTVAMITVSDQSTAHAKFVVRYTKTTDTAESPVRLVGGGSGDGGGPVSLTDITDTSITSPENNDVLAYDEATSKWINKPIESSGTGSDGLSAYDIYVKNLPEGDTPLSEIEWLESLKGENGNDGVDSTVELTALTDKLESKGIETGKVLTSKGDGTSEWLEPSEAGSSDLVSLSDVSLDTVKDGDSLVYDEATSKWINKPSTSDGINYVQSDTEPSDPKEGDEWFNLSDGVLYKRVSDGTSQVWLDISGASYSNIAGLKYVWENEASRNSQTEMTDGNQGFQKDNYTVYEYSNSVWVELYKTSPDVVNGKSAYQSYLDTTTDNPKKSESEWIDSLKGENGVDGNDGADGKDGKDFTLDDFLTDFSINGKNFDSNGNIDLEGLSTMSYPKLNEEVLTEYRHPVTGKPIYTKTIDFGSLPNATTKAINHGVVDAEEVWIDESKSFADPSNGVIHPIQYTHPNHLASSWFTVTTVTSISITTGSNRTTFTAIVTILYTKTTDTAESPVRLVGGGSGSSSGGLDPNEDIVLSAGKGVVMASENGTRYKLYIDNDGRITTEAI